MDRSFLSSAEVIAASREFVCIRLLSYENKEEMEYIKAFNITRSGEAENTLVCVMSPDAKKRLTRAGRSTRMLFADAQDMADSMDRIASDVRKSSVTPMFPVNALPIVQGVRLAVNVASSDNQPLVIAYYPDPQDLARNRELLTKAAWSGRFVGRFIFAATADVKELSTIDGAGKKAGILVVQPDKFGTKGTVLARIEGDCDQDQLDTTLRKAIVYHQIANKAFMNHVREGHQLGVFWETPLPVTDYQEAQARERGRSMRR